MSSMEQSVATFTRLKRHLKVLLSGRLKTSAESGIMSAFT